jgi:hypothetical protein
MPVVHDGINGTASFDTQSSGSQVAGHEPPSVSVVAAEPEPTDIAVNGGGKPGHLPTPEWGGSARHFLTVGPR